MSDRPVRVQLSRRKGWRMPPGTVRVDRSTLFGNPFPVDLYGRETAVDLFRRWMTGDMSTSEMSGLSRTDKWSAPPVVSLVSVRAWMLQELPRLKGKNLGCWCRADQPCHADVLLEIANKD